MASGQSFDLRGRCLSAAQNVAYGPLRHFAATQQTVAFRGTATVAHTSGVRSEVADVEHDAHGASQNRDTEIIESKTPRRLGAWGFLPLAKATQGALGMSGGRVHARARLKLAGWHRKPPLRFGAIALDVGMRRFYRAGRMAALPSRSLHNWRARSPCAWFAKTARPFKVRLSPGHPSGILLFGCDPCSASLEFIFFGMHTGSGYGGNRYASSRANPGRPSLLLSALRSPLCGDAFAAAFEERAREQCRQMCSVRKYHGQMGFNRSSHLQTRSPA
jgi:hypothetical protein